MSPLPRPTAYQLPATEQEVLKVYLAGVYSGGGRASEETTENLAVTKDLPYPYLLESYHYIGKGDRMADAIRRYGDKIFLDSGAFSMHTQGITVDLESYADFIVKNSDIIEVASNLDVIGEGNEEGTYKNQKTLESLLQKRNSPLSIQPVHHARDKDEWLQRYLDEGYEYIFLGGMVPESTEYLRTWLDRMWGKYLTNPDGSAKVKVHGFGLTTLELMIRYPWYSVDSTSWVLASRFGGIYVDFPQPNGTIRDLKIDISSQSPSAYRYDAHYDTMTPANRAIVDARLKELGYDPALLREMYGWRDHFNMTYFWRSMARGTRKFIPPQVTLDLF